MPAKTISSKINGSISIEEKANNFLEKAEKNYLSKKYDQAIEKAWSVLKLSVDSGFRATAYLIAANSAGELECSKKAAIWAKRGFKLASDPSLKELLITRYFYFVLSGYPYLTQNQKTRMLHKLAKSIQ